jgi:hypothetical protein
MPRSLAVIYTEEDRRRILAAVKAAPIGSRVDIKGPKRTLDQNSRMWCMLTDIVRQEKNVIGGLICGTEELKAIFMQERGLQPDVLPTLDGRGFFVVGHSSSRLSKAEMAELIESIFAYGAEQGVVWSDPQTKAYEEMMRR